MRGGARFAGDWSVDNRRYVAALRQAASRAGVRTVRGRVTAVSARQDRACGVRLATGDTVSCDTVVVAAGCWSGEIAGLPEPLASVVRPVKGKLLRLRLPGGMPAVLAARCAPPCAGPRSTWCRGRTAS